VRPTIVGPVAWPGLGPPPRFVVDPGVAPLFMVELAVEPALMGEVERRTRDNYFYGGDADSVFATGHLWCVPGPAWARLGRSRVLYYRVVTFDHDSGLSALSVDDEHLDALPRLVVQGPSTTGTC
jgi:hypothetical protein